MNFLRRAVAAVSGRRLVGRDPHGNTYWCVLAPLAIPAPRTNSTVLIEPAGRSTSRLAARPGQGLRSMARRPASATCVAQPWWGRRWRPDRRAHRRGQHARCGRWRFRAGTNLTLTRTRCQSCGPHGFGTPPTTPTPRPTSRCRWGTSAQPAACRADSGCAGRGVARGDDGASGAEAGGCRQAGGAGAGGGTAGFRDTG